MNTVGAPNGRGPRFLEPAEPPIATPLPIGLHWTQLQSHKNRLLSRRPIRWL